MTFLVLILTQIDLFSIYLLIITKLGIKWENLHVITTTPLNFNIFKGVWHTHIIEENNSITDIIKSNFKNKSLIIWDTCNWSFEDYIPNTNGFIEIMSPRNWSGYYKKLYKFNLQKDFQAYTRRSQIEKLVSSTGLYMLKPSEKFSFIETDPGLSLIIDEQDFTLSKICNNLTRLGQTCNIIESESLETKEDSDSKINKYLLFLIIIIISCIFIYSWIIKKIKIRN